MKQVAKKTYIGCWNPGGDTPYALEQHVADLWKSKLWQLNHDVRWRASLGCAKDKCWDKPRGTIYEPSVMHQGDRMFVLLTGSSDPKQNILLHSAFFCSEPLKRESWRDDGKMLFYMYFQTDTCLHPAFPTKFTAVYLQNRFPKYQWAGGNTGFVLEDGDALILEQEWYDFFCQFHEEFSLDGPLYCQSPDGFSAMYEWIDENGNLEHGRAWCYLNYLKSQKSE